MRVATLFAILLAAAPAIASTQTAEPASAKPDQASAAPAIGAKQTAEPASNKPDQATEAAAIASTQTAEPAEDAPAQIVLMVGDRKPVTIASGPWQSIQFLAAQVALAADAMQWRELRARMIPPKPQKAPQ